jgi:hypothetical protein
MQVLLYLFIPKSPLPSQEKTISSSHNLSSDCESGGFAGGLFRSLFVLENFSDQDFRME